MRAGLVDEEVAAFLSGRGASLPYFRPDAVLWVTVAPTAAELHQEIDFLRAWVIPSFGWEDPKQPFVAPGGETGRLAEVLLAIAPAGYYRWRTTRAGFGAVAKRLARMRALLARRPEHVLHRVPSLLELRQQFRTALVTGDREGAEAGIRAIDHYQLDSAVNTHLMRVQTLDRFGEYAAIVADPGLDRLLGPRIPQAVRTALIRAFHAVHLAPTETQGPEAAAAAYAERVHSQIGGLLALAVPEDAPEVARSLAYRAWAAQDAKAAATLLASADVFVAPLLQALLPAAPATPQSPADLATAFRGAIERQDVRAIQALAPAVLANLHVAAPIAGVDVVEVLRSSLDARPNLGVAEALAHAAVDQPVSASTMPQSWGDLLERLRGGDWEGAVRFLALDHAERPGPERLAQHELDAAVGTLEELLTHPAFGPTSEARRVTDVALPAFVEDFVSEHGFPRPEFTPLYLQLLRLWGEHKRGSVYAPDGQVLLVLAGAVLRHSPGAEQEIAQALVEWWRARPVRAALPFLVEGLDTILDLTSEDGPAQQLWFKGAELAARHAETVPPMEWALWRRLGRRAGLHEAAVDEVLPPLPADGVSAAVVDPVRQLRLHKIAIVSLHERAAAEARALLEERTGATVLVVDEIVAGPSTKSAQSADVILFVWAAAKHAVFRAFDSVRDRLVYVQGSGAGSIVLALERWAVRRLEAIS